MKRGPRARLGDACRQTVALDVLNALLNLAAGADAAAEERSAPSCDEDELRRALGDAGLLSDDASCRAVKSVSIATTNGAAAHPHR